MEEFTDEIIFKFKSISINISSRNARGELSRQRVNGARLLENRHVELKERNWAGDEDEPLLPIASICSSLDFIWRGSLSRRALSLFAD